jgi:hypothetical protein
VITKRSIPGATVIPEPVDPGVRAAVAWLTDVFGSVERVRIGQDHRAQGASFPERSSTRSSD